MQYSDKLSDDYSKNRGDFIATDELVFSLIGILGLEGKDILDFGCGDGRYSLILSQLGAKSVTGIDNSQKMIKLAGNNLSEKYKNVKFVVADGANMPIEDGSIDIVFSNFVFHHFDEYIKPILEIKRVLKRDGILLSTFSAYDVAKGSESLINTVIPVRLGCKQNSVVVSNFIKTKWEMYNILTDNGFENLMYGDIQNSDAKIDLGYKHVDKVKKITIVSLAKKM